MKGTRKNIRNVASLGETNLRQADAGGQGATETQICKVRICKD